MRAAVLTTSAMACLLLAACGDETAADPGGDAPITQRAIAAVALEHLPDDTSRREATYTDEEEPSGALGADLRYGGDGESDGSLLRVFIAPDSDFSCEDDEYRDGCEKRQ